LSVTVMVRWHLKGSCCLSTLCPLACTQMGAWLCRSHFWGFAHWQEALSSCNAQHQREWSWPWISMFDFSCYPFPPGEESTHIQACLVGGIDLFFSLVGWGWRQSSFCKDARQLL
jgi:hypothetical protein